MIRKNIMNFRAFQGFTFGTWILYWLTKISLDSHHLHLTMLFAALTSLIASEVGFRAGRYQKETQTTK